MINAFLLILNLHQMKTATSLKAFSCYVLFTNPVPAWNPPLRKAGHLFYPPMGPQGRGREQVQKEHSADGRGIREMMD